MKKISILLLLAGIMLGMGITQVKAQSKDNAKPSITLTEYSDYECPACGAYFPMVKKLKEKYGDQLTLDLRFFPLTMHQYSALAARAAQAAKNQGKFHEMHNMLFANQDTWSKSGNPQPIFINYARDLNLDIEKFEDDLNAAETQKTIMQQKQEGRNRGVHATPTFFIEGEMIDPLPRSFSQFDQIVQKHLQQKENAKQDNG